MTGALYNFFL